MVTDPWKMFRGADFGDNIEEVVETEECKVLRLNDPSGDGLMTITAYLTVSILCITIFTLPTATVGLQAAQTFCVSTIAGKGAWNTERNRIFTII